MPKVTFIIDGEPTVIEFESGQVRPLALSPNGKLLFAVNTPDARLEIFALPVSQQRFLPFDLIDQEARKHHSAFLMLGVGQWQEARRK